MSSLISRITAENAEQMSVARGFYYQLDRAEMLPFVPASATRILDVGCGTGRFGQRLKERCGMEVWGIELNPEAADVANGVLDHVLVGDVSEQLQSLPDGYFDCITFNDVLEHMSDPGSVLRDVRPLLHADGVIVASIPNIRFYRALKRLLWDKDFPLEDWGVFDRTHLRFFTKKSIRGLFEEAGFKLQTITGLQPQAPGGVLKRILFNSALFAFHSLLGDTKYLQFACVATQVR